MIGDSDGDDFDTHTGGEVLVVPDDTDPTGEDPPIRYWQNVMHGRYVN